MANKYGGKVDVVFAAKPEARDRWRICAKGRNLPLSAWLRQIAEEECERQAALLLYKIRTERPYELNAILEETIRQHAIAKCPNHKNHQPTVLCEECNQYPYQPIS